MDDVAQARLEALVEEARSLPLSADGVIEAVVESCDDPHASMADVSERIGREPGLAAVVLRQANSAHYGFGRRVDTLVDAAVVLGVGTIRSLAIASAVLRMLAVDRDGLSSFRRELLQHSVWTGIAARTLARRQDTAHPEKAFLAGLMHELGTIVLTRAARGEYLHVIATCRREKLPFWVVERDLFGFDHAVLGSRLTEAWRFPPAISESVLHQHNPEAARIERGLAETVHVADWLAAELGQGLVPFAHPEWPDRRAADTFGLSSHGLAELCEEVRAAAGGWAHAAA